MPLLKTFVETLNAIWLNLNKEVKLGKEVLNNMSIDSFLTGLKGMITTGGYKTVKFSVECSDKDTPPNSIQQTKAKMPELDSVVKTMHEWLNKYDKSDIRKTDIIKETYNLISRHFSHLS